MAFSVFANHIYYTDLQADGSMSWSTWYGTLVPAFVIKWSILWILFYVEFN